MELPKTIILLVVYAISSMQASIVPVSGDNNSTDDQLALLSFKSLLSDPSGALSSWSNRSLHPCSWHGVTCGPAKRVTALELDSLNLTGTISPSLFNLTSLTWLHLGSNRLTGHIPQDLGRLLQLRYLNLSYNSIEGEIPMTISHCSSLQMIILAGNYLRGEIPSSLSQCSNLSDICLDQNMLTGEIPVAFASLQKLSLLYLGTNYLSGKLPSWLGSTASLTSIDLSHNNLTGAIPSSLRNLSSLVILNLSYNKLVGTIPPSLANCSALNYLILSHNSLHGHIPESLGYSPSLIEIDLSFNGLTGAVPSPLYNLSSIQVLGLGMNQLVGTLPPSIGRTLPRLQYFSVQGNQFQGPVPLSLSNASGIHFLDLSNNMFSGLVPPNLGELPFLYQLNLGSNFLEAKDAKGWSFFTSLANCTGLKFLILSDNILEGNLPIKVGNLPTQLERLLLGKNQITGSIPAEIGNLVSLTVLDLNHNLLTGTIPTAIGRLRALGILNLSQNSFSGKIPASLGNLTRLSELYLGGNDLRGSIPASFGNFINLQVLNLSYNQLDGAIPKELVSISSLSSLVDLSHNSLAGSIPSEVRSLTNLARFDVSYNRLSGEIPSSLGDCEVLQGLYMEGNFFDGPLPSYLSNLKGIQELDLSHNNLSGHIPGFLGRLDLQYLNLSFNDFEGEVPREGVFKNASAVSLIGNGELCGGDPKLQLPACSTQNSSGRHRFSALRVIIPCIVLLICLILAFLFAALYSKRKARTVSPLTSSADEGKYRKVSYNELRKATNGFSSENLVGTGSFGSVYKGRINGYNKDVAVKVLNLLQRGALKSFTAECEALRNIRHRNLVKIITSCSTIDASGADFRALVFDFLPNGSLEEWLHPKGPENHHLSLAQRLNIAIDVASALEYLHDHGETPIAHCDLKPSNVLLDDNMTAHVGDFGLAKFINGNANISSQDPSYSVALRGSIGYVAPEYGMGAKLSTYGDAYSYGILLLEMLTDKRPTDDMFKEGLDLRKFVEAASPERVLEIVDQRLLSWERIGAVPNESAARGKEEECLVAMVDVGLACSKETPKERMEMRNVVVAMHGIRVAYLG